MKQYSVTDAALDMYNENASGRLTREQRWYNVEQVLLLVRLQPDNKILRDLFKKMLDTIYP